MVLTMASSVAANEATRDRGNGDSAVSTAFKFGILLIAVFALIALLVGLYIFNNWAGILDFGGSIRDWGSNLIGGFWGGLTGIVPALGSWLMPSSRAARLSSIRGVNPQDIV
jgi:hypothetical protein